MTVKCTLLYSAQKEIHKDIVIVSVCPSAKVEKYTSDQGHIFTQVEVSILGLVLLEYDPYQDSKNLEWADFLTISPPSFENYFRIGAFLLQKKMSTLTKSSSNMILDF